MLTMSIESTTALNDTMLRIRTKGADFIGIQFDRNDSENLVLRIHETNAIPTHCAVAEKEKNSNKFHEKNKSGFPNIQDPAG